MLTRDSAWLWLPFLTGLSGIALEHFDLLQRAFPGMGATGHARIELAAVMATSISAYLRMSPLAIHPEAPVRKMSSDPSNTLSVIGKPKN